MILFIFTSIDQKVVPFKVSVAYRWYQVMAYNTILLPRK